MSEEKSSERKYNGTIIRQNSEAVRIQLKDPPAFNYEGRKYTVEYIILERARVKEYLNGDANIRDLPHDVAASGIGREVKRQYKAYLEEQKRLAAAKQGSSIDALMDEWAAEDRKEDEREENELEKERGILPQPKTVALKDFQGKEKGSLGGEENY